MSDAAAINGFTLTHAAIHATQGISPIERLVLATVSSFANILGTCWPSNQTLADKTGLHERTVRRQLETLQEKGFIERISRGVGRAMLTRILITPQAQTSDIVPPTPDIVPPYEPIKNLQIPITAAPALPLPETASAAIVVSEIPEQPEQPDTTMLALEFTPGADTFTPLLDEPVPTANELAAPEPVSAPSIDENPLAGVPETLLQDLGEVRRAKKKPAKPTKTEANLWWAEAQKAGWTMEQVILTMVLRGWSRFDASWVQHVPQQAVVQGREAVFKPEPVQPASPGAIARFKEAWARQKAQMLADAARRREEQMAVRR